MAHLSGTGLYSKARKIAREYPTHYRGTNGSEAGQYNIGQWDGQNFCFDCSGLIKAILWGWNGDKNAAYGGAVYNSNDCPDINDAGFGQYCTNKISTVDTAPVGAVLWKSGHVGIYGGNGKTVECTINGYKVGEGTVSTTGARTINGVSGSNWEAWGCPPFINYTGGTSTDPQDMDAEDTDWAGEFVKALKSHLGEGYNGCSYYITQCLKEIGYCPDGETTPEGYYMHAMDNEHGVLDNTNYFEQVSGSPQEGDIMVDWGNHVAAYGDGGTYESIPNNGGHGSAGGVVHWDGVCSCLGSPTIYRMTKTGGSSTRSSSSSNGTGGGGRSFSGTSNLHSRTVDESSLQPYTTYKAEVNNVVTTRTVSGDMIQTNSSVGATAARRGTNLVSTSTLVESPFVILELGNYSFGSYNKKQQGQNTHVQYPNFITGIQIIKINGSVNQYTINMQYRIQPGDNPNMIDEILSQVGYGTVYISYGDWCMPSFIFRRESALITNVSTSVDFANYTIAYTIKCTSNAVAIAGLTYYFPQKVTKPSSLIWNLISHGNNYGLHEAFPGLYTDNKAKSDLYSALVNLGDKAVTIEAQENMNPVSYISYLISCMIPEGSGNGLTNASYYMNVLDNEHGATFTVNRIDANTQVPDNYNVYEVDIGYPDLNNNSNVVYSFGLNNDSSWSLLYNYGSQTDLSDTVYKIDDTGTLFTEKSQNMFTRNKTYTQSAKQMAWWSNMTQFPVTATLKIKGLLRPQMLMSYVRVNSFFYGHKHVSSGLYVVTKEVDDVTAEGYRTTLSLTRIAGDNDSILQGTKTIETKLPVVTYKEETRTPTVTRIADPTGQNWERTATYYVSGNGADVTDTSSGGGGINADVGNGNIKDAIKIKDGQKVTADERAKLLSEEYMMVMCASYCKQLGWTKNATIGLMCYAIAEGRVVGFYSHENPWAVPDPLGQYASRTYGERAEDYPEICTSNDEWLNKWCTFQNGYTNYQNVGAACPCLGIGLLSESDCWDTNGNVLQSEASNEIRAAKAKGVSWLDPSFQISYSIDRFMQNKFGDSDFRDPKTFTGSVEEYAERTLCCYGMSGWHYGEHSQAYASYWNADKVNRATAYYNAANA